MAWKLTRYDAIGSSVEAQSVDVKQFNVVKLQGSTSLDTLLCMKAQGLAEPRPCSFTAPTAGTGAAARIAFPIVVRPSPSGPAVAFAMPEVVGQRPALEDWHPGQFQSLSRRPREYAVVRR